MPQIPSAALSDARIIAAYIIFLASYLFLRWANSQDSKLIALAPPSLARLLWSQLALSRQHRLCTSLIFQPSLPLFSMMLIVGNLHLVGFFEWIAEVVLRRLRPARLLPAVIFTSGIFSAFFVNDIVCLVMMPFVLNITRRMKLPPLPYLFAVATASNIGSVATITGNPQNMLIGSFSGISYRDFLWHLGPVALIGLFLDWAVLHWVYGAAEAKSADIEKPIPLPPLDLSRLSKPVIVVAAVVAGFFTGVPPAMMAALGAAVLLITRTLDPHKLYEEVDWGLLVFFVGLFLIVGGAEYAGIVRNLLELAEHWNLQHLAVFTIAVEILSNIVSNVPAVILLKSLVPGFFDPHTAWLVLAMASTLAGNLTITGSVANIIVVESARPDVHVSFWDYFRAGAPITAATLLIGWAWLAWIR